MSAPATAGRKLPFHSWDVEKCLRHFATDREDGLTKVDAAGRLEKYGANELLGQSGVSKWKVFVAQLANSMTIVLLLAFIISMAVRDWVEAGVVMVVIITNSLIGFFQEYRAEKTMASLRNLTCPTALVVREGAQHHIPALQVVPGDIIQFKDGDVIPADSRLLEIFNLEIDEALLTGESAPVAKKTAALEMENAAVGDRVNLAYSSTVVTKGRGKGIVISTGMGTEIGQIAKALSHTEETGKTILQQRVDQLAVKLLAFAVMLAVIVFSVNRWDITADVALYAISLSIAVIPEGLVAVMTITMAVSVRAMAKQKAIVRKLSALEAVGQVSNICSDKTGTITQGRMVLSKLHLPGVGNFNVTGEGYNPVGEINRPPPVSPKQVGAARPSVDGPPLSRHEYPEQLRSLGRVAALCNQAVLRKPNRLPATTVVVDIFGGERDITALPLETSETTLTSGKEEPSQEKGNEREVRDGGWTAFGDPTECAIQVFATKIGMGKPDLTGDYEPVAEFPFESAIKTASVIVKHKPTGEVFVLLKGATEQVMRTCKGIDEGAILREMECLASHGLRVLALAHRKVAEGLTDDELRCWKREEANKDMTLLGLVGIFDPPRPQSKGAIQACARAGISVHMLTGDHPKTAAAIALSVGLISRAEAKATTGSAAAPAPASVGGAGLELFRSITMAAEEQPTANMVMTALEFDALTDREIDRLAHLPKVIARCAPHTKTRMVEALHRRKKVVAMTGDGVNDAPSLKAADVGIAMGLAGSDVAKQASDIVLTNDNFATITKAVFEGRRIFENIQKFILHLMSTNVAEVILLVIGLSFMAREGNEVASIYPMSPVQILWLNMVTSSPPAMGLGFEKAEGHLQEAKPRPKSKGLFGRELLADIFIYGALMGMLTLTNWTLVLYTFGDGLLQLRCTKVSYDNSDTLNDNHIPGGQLCNTLYRARATVFLSLIFMILLHSINCRHSRRLGFVGLLRNKFLLWSIIFGSVISIPMVYIPGAHVVFQHAPIGGVEWAIVIISNIAFVALSIVYKVLKQAVLKPLGRSEEDEEEPESEEDEEDAYAVGEINRAIA